MSPIAGQTAGPNGLNFFVDTQGWPGSKAKKIRNFLFSKFFFSNNFFFQHFFSTGNAGPFS